MKILNIKGTAELKCNCGTWKEHWKNMSGRNKWPRKCGVKGCRNDAKVGAHVKFDDGRTTDHWYILPMCRSCNGKKHNLTGVSADKRFWAIWANQAGTCGS